MKKIAVLMSVLLVGMQFSAAGSGSSSDADLNAEARRYMLPNIIQGSPSTMQFSGHRFDPFYLDTEPRTLKDYNFDFARYPNRSMVIGSVVPREWTGSIDYGAEMTAELKRQNKEDDRRIKEEHKAKINAELEALRTRRARNESKRLGLERYNSAQEYRSGE